MHFPILTIVHAISQNFTWLRGPITLVCIIHAVVKELIFISSTDAIE